MKGKGAFEEVSRRVVRRVFVARWLRLLAHSGAALFPLAAACILTAWLVRGTRTGPWPAAGLVLAWLLVTGFWAFLRRPSPVAAMALWDERAGRREMFVSAWCFERLPDPDAGERLHLARAGARLAGEVRRLRRQLPLGFSHWTWVLPGALLALAALLPGAEPGRDQAAIDDDARANAAEVAGTLEEAKGLLTGNEQLTPEEKEKLRKLEADLKETADRLRRLEDKTPRDVLADLERRAHEAEALADQLDAAAEAELSSEMLAELERHADTTDLAAALRAKDLDKAAQEADKLAERLADKDLSLEEQKRIESALDQALKKASESDKEGLVGKHLKEAHEGLKKDRPKTAAEKLRQLSKRLQESRLRQLARQRLQGLANQLRSSGQQIFGRSATAIRRLPQNNLAGLQTLGAQQLQAMGNLPLAHLGQLQPGQITPGTPVVLVPGSFPPGTPTGNLLIAPVPGTGNPQAICPIPGSCPGGTMGGAPVPGAGACPVPGSSLAGGAAQAASTGGLEAGRGTAPYGNTPTAPLAPTGTGVVNAAPSGGGPSSVRAVDGGAHREEAGRERQKLAAAAIQAEEEALAEEPLPLARRQQVLRYFTAIRRQLVDHESRNRP